MRTAKYGSKKITGTDLVAVEGNVIEILEDAVFTTINEAGITTPITSHNVSGVQSAGERIFAHTKFTGVQLASGSVRVGGFRRRKKVGLSGTIKNALAIWLFGGVPRDSYVTDKHGQQDRELLDGEIFPGRAYEGDGTNYVQYAEISNELEVNNGDLSLSIWTRATSVSAYHGLAGKGVAGVREGSYEILWNTSGNQVRAIINTSGGSRSIYGTSGKDDGEWHHYILQIDNTSKEVKLYEDGVHVGSTLDITGETMDIMGPAWEFTIGARNAVGGSGVSSIWNGPSIRDVRVIKRLLTADDIALLYAQKAVGDEAVWYPCEDTDLSTAFDVSGNGYHATKVSFDAGNHVEGNWQSLMNKYGYNQNVTYDEVPPDMSSGVIPTLDCLGNDLVYAGQAQYHGISKEAACFQGDGVAHYSLTTPITISGTDTIEITFSPDAVDTYYSFFGKGLAWSYLRMKSGDPATEFQGETDLNDDFFIIEHSGITLTVGQVYTLVFGFDGNLPYAILNGTRFNATAAISNPALTVNYLAKGYSHTLFPGRIWDFKITRGGSHILNAPLCEGAGTKAYDVSGNGNHLTGVDVDETNWGTQDDFHYLRDYGMSMQSANKVINGTFDTDSDWIKGPNWSIHDGIAECTGGVPQYLNQSGILTTKTFYKITYDIVEYTSGIIFTILCGNSNGPHRSAIGSYEEIRISGTSNSIFYFQSNAFVGKVDNVIVQELNLVIPALADKSAAADGGTIEYPQSGINAIPGTKFHLPENIAELIAADQAPRLLNIMDPGKGVFTEILTDKITNGGFELGNFSDWLDFNAPVKEINTTDPHSGNYCAKITATVDYSGIRQTISVVSGNWYKVTVWYKCISGSANIAFTGAFTNTYTYSDSEWTKAEFIFQAGDTSLNVYVRGRYNTNIILFDDISIVEQNVESWTACGTNKIENDNGALKITYQDNANGAETYLRETDDINTDLTVGVSYRLMIKAKINSGSANFYITGPNQASDAITNTDYEWIEIDFVATHTNVSKLLTINLSAGEIIWIDEWYLEMIDRFIPALADKSADALGGVIQYPQNGPNAIPDTYFHLPENIAELVAADLEDRYMDIMDDGKGVFTEITDNSVANGDFDTDTDWTKGTGWTISGGKAVATASSNYLYQTVLTIGKWYKITFTVSDYSAGIVRVLCGAASSGISRNSDGTYTQVLQCSGNNIFYFDAISSFTGKVDNVSVVEQNVEGWAAYDSNILANDNGSLRIEYVDSGSGANLFLKEANDINKDLVIGNQYIFHYRAKDNGDGNQHLRISDGIAVQDGDLLTTSFQWYEIPFQAESTDGCFVYCDNNANGIIWIDDCFLTEQQTSVGNNLVINGAKWIDSDDDGEPDDWTETNPTQSTSSIVTGNGFVGNALRHEWDTADATSAAYLETNVSILSGTTIQLTFKQRNLNGLRIYFDGDSLELATNISSDETGDAVAHSVLFTASADKTTMKVYIGTSNSHVTGDYYEIDEVEVRPVIDSFFYEPLVLGGDPVIINTSDLPPSRYLVQYYNETNRKDLILLAAGHDLGPDDHKKLLKFTKND